MQSHTHTITNAGTRSTLRYVATIQSYINSYTYAYILASAHTTRDKLLTGKNESLSTYIQTHMHTNKHADMQTGIQTDGHAYRDSPTAIQ